MQRGSAEVYRNERLINSKLWSMEVRKNRQDLTEVFKICKGMSRIKLSEHFTLEGPVDKEPEGSHSSWQNFGTCRTVESICFDNDIYRWNQVDQLAVDAFSNIAFKSCLDRLKHTRIGFSWIKLLSHRPPWLDFQLVRPQKVSNEV